MISPRSNTGESFFFENPRFITLSRFSFFYPKRSWKGEKRGIVPSSPRENTRLLTAYTVSSWTKLIPSGLREGGCINSLPLRKRYTILKPRGQHLRRGISRTRFTMLAEEGRKESHRRRGNTNLCKCRKGRSNFIEIYIHPGFVCNDNENFVIG